MPTNDVRRRVMGLVTMMNRQYRLNPTSVKWEPAVWPKDDQTLFMAATINGNAAGTFALGTLVVNTLDGLMGDFNWWIGTTGSSETIPAGRVMLEAVVNGTRKRRWLRTAAGESLVGQGAGPFDLPLLRVPAGGTMIMQVVIDAAGTFEAGCSGFVARY